MTGMLFIKDKYLIAHVHARRLIKFNLDNKQLLDFKSVT